MKKEIIKLKPKGSMISHSDLTNTNYHVIKFYSRVYKKGNSWVHIGFEATDQHKLGECQFCEIKE